MTWRVGYAPTARGPIQLMEEARSGDAAFKAMFNIATKMSTGLEYDSSYHAFSHCVIAGEGFEFYGWRVIASDEDQDGVADFDRWWKKWGELVSDYNRPKRRDARWMIVMRKSARATPRTGYREHLDDLCVAIAANRRRIGGLKHVVVFYIAEIDKGWVARCLVREHKGARSNPRWIA